MKNFKIVHLATEFLVGKISSVFNIPAVKINIDKKLTEYGLDSLQAISIVYELEEFFEIELPCDLIWNYTTIKEIAVFVSLKVR